MTRVERVDLRKQQKSLYAAPPGAATIVDVPAMNFLMVDGEGDPNASPTFAAAIEALYGVAFTLKFTLKRTMEPVDFRVMPLEALWWADSMAAFGTDSRDAWQWTLMIAQPPFITREQVATAIERVRAKKPSSALEMIRFEAFEEGLSAQLLHVGPYSTEAPNIVRLHDFIAGRGGALRGKHHEIYLSDARRTAPEKLKTIIRQGYAPRPV